MHFDIKIVVKDILENAAMFKIKGTTFFKHVKEHLA
jgi:hypothetical protein